MLAAPCTHGDAATKRELRNRLHRIAGQVRGVERMIDEDRDSSNVIVQIAAAQAALDGVALSVLDAHVRGCAADDAGSDELTEELMAAVARLLRRR